MEKVFNNSYIRKKFIVTIKESFQYQEKRKKIIHSKQRLAVNLIILVVVSNFYYLNYFFENSFFKIIPIVDIKSTLILSYWILFILCNFSLITSIIFYIKNYFNTDYKFFNIDNLETNYKNEETTNIIKNEQTLDDLIYRTYKESLENNIEVNNKRIHFLNLCIKFIIISLIISMIEIIVFCIIRT